MTMTDEPDRPAPDVPPEEGDEPGRFGTDSEPEPRFGRDTEEEGRFGTDKDAEPRFGTDPEEAERFGTDKD